MLCGICTLSCLLHPAVLWLCVVTFRRLQANACLLWVCDPQVVCTPNQLLLGCASWQWTSLQALYNTRLLRTGCKVTLTDAQTLVYTRPVSVAACMPEQHAWLSLAADHSTCQLSIVSSPFAQRCAQCVGEVHSVASGGVQSSHPVL
jgi:hypothetical protein